MCVKEYSITFAPAKQFTMDKQKKTFMPSLWDGAIMAATLMLGIAIGAKSGNIKMGAACGLLAGAAAVAAINLFRYISHNKNDRH